MAADNFIRSYGDSSMKEDVLGLVEILTAVENQFLTRLSPNRAIATVHSTLTDTLRAPTTSRAVAEGVDATILAGTTPSRVTNVVETIAIPFAVSGVQEAVDHYHETNELTRQTTKALKEWGNAAELDIVRSTIVSGASGTAVKMAGVIAGITTNATAQTSGTTLNLSHILAILQDVYDNGNGKMVTDIFVGGTMKRRISTFTTSNTKNVDASAKTAVEVVNVLDTDFGQVRLNLHRFVQISSDATGRLLGVNMDTWRLAYLRKPFIQELARTGDASKKQVIGDLTLEKECEPANFFMSGFLKAA